MTSTTAPPRAPRPPRGLHRQGKALWNSILSEFEIDVHERVTLYEACRVADRLDAIGIAAESSDLLVTNAKGDEVANPLLIEARQQAIVYTRLVASLRLPTGEDESGGLQRPQRRGGARGVYDKGSR